MKKIESKIISIIGSLSRIKKEFAFKAAKEGSNTIVNEIKPTTTNKPIEEIKKESPNNTIIEYQTTIFSLFRSAIESLLGKFKKHTNAPKVLITDNKEQSNNTTTEVTGWG